MHYIMLDLKTKRVYFLRCLSSKNADSFLFVCFSCKFRSRVANSCPSVVLLRKLQFGFYVIVPALRPPRSHQVPCQRSCYPVVHCCSNRQTRLRITPTSPGEQYACLCCVWQRTTRSVQARKTQTPCSYSLSLCKHVLTKHALSLDLTQTQSSVQGSPTAALNYINYHGQRTHTLSSPWLQP